jgi:hypothetical protein
MKLIILLTFACAGISFTITTTSIFKWLREIISDIHPKLEELIHCPWCLNHYISFIFLLAWTDVGVVSFIVYWFGVIGAGGIIHYILLRAYKPVARSMTQRKIDKLNAEESRKE